MSDTTAGIDSLIARIRKDAVEAGQGEREQILADARKEADRLLASARADAQKTRENAEDSARSARRQLDAELRMAARDFVTALSQKLREQVIDPAIEADTAAQLHDPNVLGAAITSAVAGLAKGKPAEVIVSSDSARLLQGAAWQRITAQAQDGLTLRGDGGGGFKLVFDGEHIVWDFSDEAVGAELARLVAPSMRAHFQLDQAAARTN